MQYTLRNVPKAVDKALRAKARAQRKSLNQVAVEALGAGLGVTNGRAKARDLSDIHSAPPDADDARAMDQARKAFEQVDEAAWR